VWKSFLRSNPQVLYKTELFNDIMVRTMESLIRLQKRLVKIVCAFGMMLPLFFSVAKAETSATDSIKVTFLNSGISDPNDPTGGFWLSVSAFMKAAAEDFNIDLEIIYAERDHLLMREQGEAVVKR